MLSRGQEVCTKAEASLAKSAILAGESSERRIGAGGGSAVRDIDEVTDCHAFWSSARRQQIGQCGRTFMTAKLPCRPSVPNTTAQPFKPSSSSE